MIILGLLLFSIVVFYIWWFHLKTPGLPRRQDELKGVVKELLVRGHSNGLLILTHSKTKLFVQMYKYVDGKDVGVMLSIPQADWSQKYIGPLKKSLEDKGVEYNISFSGAVGDLPFVEADFAKDTDRAYTVIRTIFNDVYGISEEEAIHVRLMNAT